MDALQHGFISVEADILLKEGILYVGHDREDLVNKSLIDLTASYIDPLFERYNATNKKIYPGYDDLFYLWIDIKYAGEEVFTRLKKIIRPYRSMIFSKKRNKKGKVMIIVSGDRPIQLLLKDTGGYLHIDGRPSDLEKNIDSDRMPFISQHIQQVCSLNSSGYLDDDNFNRLKELVHKCHSQGKKVRLWATPENEKIWKQLRQANVDLINTDSLARLTNYLKLQNQVPVKTPE